MYRQNRSRKHPPARGTPDHAVRGWPRSPSHPTLQTLRSHPETSRSGASSPGRRFQKRILPSHSSAPHQEPPHAPKSSAHIPGNADDSYKTCQNHRRECRFCGVQPQTADPPHSVPLQYRPWQRWKDSQNASHWHGSSPTHTAHPHRRTPGENIPDYRRGTKAQAAFSPCKEELPALPHLHPRPDKTRPAYIPFSRSCAGFPPRHWQKAYLRYL